MSDEVKQPKPDFQLIGQDVNIFNLGLTAEIFIRKINYFFVKLGFTNRILCDIIKQTG